MSSTNQEPKRRGRPRKDVSKLATNPTANAVRAYRERKRAENEANLLEEQRVYKNMYNREWKNIRENKPDYSKDRSYEELVSERYNKYKAPEPDRDSDKNSDTDSDKTEDKDDAMSVKSSEQLENILNEALQEVTEEIEKGRNYEKNKKKRMRKKQEKKKNKITEEEALEEDVD